MRCQVCGDENGTAAGEFCIRCGARDGKELQGRGSGEYAATILGMIQAMAPETGFEGLFLKEYDPRRRGTTPDGRPLLCYIEATELWEEALRFADIGAARREWMRWDGTLRSDGKPSRPLTAFNIQFGKKEAFER
jgi:hypothetical protein